MRSGHKGSRGRPRRRRKTPYKRATAVVFSQDNEVLLVKHHGQDHWALPGGRVMDGEDPAQRAVTEVADETGVRITDPEHVGRYAGTVASHEIYLAKGSGEASPEHREIQDAIWWDLVQPLQVQPHVNAILDIVDPVGDDIDNLDEEEIEVSPDQADSPPVLDRPASQPVEPPDESLEGPKPGSDSHRPRNWTSYAATAWAWVVIVALLIADWLIWVMLRTRSNERRIRPTKRVTWPKGLKQELMKRQDNTCVYCGYRRIARTLDIDHMIPAVRGGSNDISNLQVICRPCNQRKGPQTDEEFRARYSRLVPATPLTPPQRRITQNEFKEETRRTSQAASAREFRRTRFITPREKIVSGCLMSGGIVFGILLFGLAAIGAEGLLLLFPALALGVAVGLGIWIRAYITGATSEVEG